ncbi:1,4-beta-mannosyl-N-acetylglucosamine phosphorylase [bacterium HR34]|nr:1,4-beta-mannosyl-N-acetylglucosamine phosphorylase [bacterium HR34]
MPRNKKSKTNETKSENKKTRTSIKEKGVKKTSKKKETKKKDSKKVSRKGKVTKVKTIKKPSHLEFVRYEENPIIAPKEENEWEAWQTFNPTAIVLNNQVHFLYRAVGKDGISRFGYALSNDGFIIDERLPYPVYEHKIPRPVFNIYSYFSGGSWGGAEDPRIVRVNNEDTLYMTYTACDNCLGIAITSIKLEDFLNRRWKWKDPKIISKPGEVHKNWVIFPEKINGKYAILHSINPNISIAYRDSLEFKEGEYIESYYKPEFRENCWDNWTRGVGPVPIKTEYGWLIFYHAISANDFGKYKVGAMLLDLKDPTKILVRSPYPILEPNDIYENNGCKSGVVYASGAVVKDGNILIYYGASDSYVCVAYANLEEFLTALIKNQKLKLITQTLKRKIK